ncbi:hypothetical protein [Shouchella shacheensis]|uniref:hypothetical protein n=1 Tax=Shouchella shacheensis TaxID=1649580 RepID=UPI00073FFDC6|nr:hypothetical protein [Shouchella shacheensis]
MFFEKDDTPKEVTNNAYFVVFAFWGSALFLLSLYHTWVENVIGNTYSIILASGLVVFFLTIYVQKWKNSRN